MASITDSLSFGSPLPSGGRRFALALSARPVPGIGAGTRLRLAIAGAGILTAVALYAAMLAPLGVSGQGALPILAVFLAALVSSIAGFAFSAICGALLLHLLGSPIEIVQILLLCSVMNQSLAVYELRRDIVWPRLLPFLLAGALGVPAGAYVLLHSEPQLYTRAFGCLLVVYSIYMLLRRPVYTPRGGQIGDWVSGLTGGFIGGFAAFPGATVSVWASMRGWDKVQQRAVYQPFILIMQIVALAVMQVMAAGGGPRIELDPAILTYLPASLLGTWCGLRVFRWLTDRQFGLVVNLMLVVSGAMMIG